MEDTKKTGGETPKKEVINVEKAQKIEHDNIYSALASFQSELPVIPQTKMVSFTANGRKIEYKYAPLEEIMEVILPLLSKNGLSIRHEITNDGVEAILTHETFEQEALVVKTRTYNADGSSIEKEETIKTGLNQLKSGVVKFKPSTDMKDLGGNITYARRYTLHLLLGISSEEDLDTQIQDAKAENAEKFAFAQAKAGIEKSTSVKELSEKITFLNKELETIAEGKVAPSIGLEKGQYEELITLATNRITKLNEKENGGN